MTQPGRNDPCPCGSGKKYKHCCSSTAPRPVDVAYAPVIDPSLRDLERREAEFWRPLEGGKVACDLCYRLCEIEDGESGWCKYRRNEGGRLVIPQHGTVSGIMKEHLGVGDSAYTSYKAGMRGIFVGGIRCTSSCGFCMSKQLVWKPDGVPWVDESYGPGRLLVNNSWFYGRRARYTPEQIIDNALRVGAGSVELGVNEPLMSIEYSLDVARMARRHGLDVLIDTNGFSTAPAIRKLAPYVNAVLYGLKGSCDPEFYARWMRAPGAVPQVLESLKVWHEFDHVHILASDLLAPPHMQSAEAAEAAQERLYGWLAAEFGPYTLLGLSPMVPPIDLELSAKPNQAPKKSGHLSEFLLARGGDAAQVAEYQLRIAGALYAAKAAGLLYVFGKTAEGGLFCHNCGVPLVKMRSPMLSCAPCTLAVQFCPFWSVQQRVTADGNCMACGAQTPLVGMTEAELKREAAWRKIAYRGGSVRTRVLE